MVVGRGGYGERLRRVCIAEQWSGYAKPEFASVMRASSITVQAPLQFQRRARSKVPVEHLSVVADASHCARHVTNTKAV